MQQMYYSGGDVDNGGAYACVGVEGHTGILCTL